MTLYNTTSTNVTHGQEQSPAHASHNWTSYVKWWLRNFRQHVQTGSAPLAVSSFLWFVSTIAMVSTDHNMCIMEGSASETRQRGRHMIGVVVTISLISLAWSAAANRATVHGRILAANETGRARSQLRLLMKKRAYVMQQHSWYFYLFVVVLLVSTTLMLAFPTRYCLAPPMRALITGLLMTITTVESDERNPRHAAAHSKPLVHIITRFPILHLPMAVASFMSVPAALMFWIGDAFALAFFLPAVAILLLTVGAIATLTLAQNTELGNSSFFSALTGRFTCILASCGHVRTRTVALKPEETQAWYRELPAMWRIILLDLFALQLFMPVELLLLIFRSFQATLQSEKSNLGMTGELFWAAEHHQEIRALQQPFFTSMFEHLELTTNGLVILVVANMVTLMTSCLAWDATFFTLAMAQQNKQQQQSTAMLRWLSHECRSPVSAALLTVEYLLSDVMPACRDRVEHLLRQSVPSSSLSSFKYAAAPHKRVSSLKSLHRTVTVEGEASGTGTERPGQQVGLLAGTLALSRASGSKSFDTAAHALPAKASLHNIRNALRQSDPSRSDSGDGSGSRVTPGAGASTQPRADAAPPRSPQPDSRLERLVPESKLHATAEIESGQRIAGAQRSWDGKSMTSGLEEHAQPAVPLTLSFDINGDETPLQLLDEVQQYIEMMAQPMTALSGVLDNMLLYMKKQHAVSDGNGHGTVRPFGMRTFSSLGTIGVGSLLESAWQNATASQDVLVGGGLRENAVGLATSVGTLALETSGSVSSKSSLAASRRASLASRSPKASQRALTPTDGSPLRMASPLCSMAPSQGLLFLQGMAFRSKVTQSTCLQVVTNYLTNAIKYGRSTNMDGEDESNILLEITLLQLTPAAPRSPSAAANKASGAGAASVISRAPAPWQHAVTRAQLLRHNTMARMRGAGQAPEPGVSDMSSGFLPDKRDKSATAPSSALPTATVRMVPDGGMLDDSGSSPSRVPARLQESDTARSSSYRGLDGGSDAPVGQDSRELSLAVSDSLRGRHIATFSVAPAGALKRPGQISTPQHGRRSPNSAAAHARTVSDRTVSATDGTMPSAPLSLGIGASDTSRFLSSMHLSSTVSGSPRRPAARRVSSSEGSSSLGSLPSRLQPFQGCLDKIMQGFADLQAQEGERPSAAGAAAAAGMPAAPVELQHGVLVLSVTDHGRGLTLEERESLFQPFARLRSGATAKGNGLGLWLMKELIESQGGTLAVHSAGLDMGSTFAAFVPVQYEVGTAAAAWEMHMQESEQELQQGHTAAHGVALNELEAPVPSVSLSREAPSPEARPTSGIAGAVSRSTSSGRGKDLSGSVLTLKSISRAGNTGLEPQLQGTAGSGAAEAAPVSGRHAGSLSLHPPLRLHGPGDESDASDGVANMTPAAQGVSQAVSLGPASRSHTRKGSAASDSDGVSPRVEDSGGGSMLSGFQFGAIQRVSRRISGKSRRSSGVSVHESSVRMPSQRAATDGARSSGGPLSRRGSAEGAADRQRRLGPKARSAVKEILRTLSNDAASGAAAARAGGLDAVPASPGASSLSKVTTRPQQAGPHRGSSSQRRQPLTPDAREEGSGPGKQHQAAGAARASAAAGPPAHGFTGSVMVVDDAPTNRTLLARQVKRLGYTVHTAEDGLQGLSVFEQRHGVQGGVGLVITDMTMPHLNGDGMVRRMVAACAAGGWPVPVFVVVSGNVLEDDQAAMRAAGAHVVLSKPAKLADIMQRAKEVAERGTNA